MSKLAIIAASYNHSDGRLQTFVYSLVAQTSKDFNLYVVHDGPADETTRSFMKEMVVKNPNISYIETPEKSKYKWGHESRIYGLNFLKDEDTYVTYSNTDNIYFKDYVFYMKQAMKEYPDIITNDIVHNYFSYSRFGGGAVGWYVTDFMNYAVKKDIATEMSLYVDMNEADAQFAKEFAEKYPSASNIYIDAMLGVHQ